MAVEVKAGWIEAVRELEASLADGTAVPAATTTKAGIVKKATTQANFAGADVPALLVELNAFLAKLKTAGIVA